MFTDIPAGPVYLNEVDESDPVRAYIVDNDFLRFDTLCVIPLTRHYYQE